VSELKGSDASLRVSPNLDPNASALLELELAVLAFSDDAEV
jgi:hypothetical protein